MKVLSRDSVTVTVDAVIYYRVSNPTMVLHHKIFVSIDLDKFSIAIIFMIPLKVVIKIKLRCHHILQSLRPNHGFLSQNIL